jgi:hypothetical protein
MGPLSPSASSSSSSLSPEPSKPRSGGGAIRSKQQARQQILISEEALNPGSTKKRRKKKGKVDQDEGDNDDSKNNSNEDEQKTTKSKQLKRGYAANLRKHQQIMLKPMPPTDANAKQPPPDYPGALNTLLDDLSSAQPMDGNMAMAFSMDSLLKARARINQFPQKVWRVWLPDPVKSRYMLFKSLYAPEGTTLAEFAEMLLALKRKEDDGSERPGGLDLSVLHKKEMAEVPVDVSCNKHLYFQLSSQRPC